MSTGATVGGAYQPDGNYTRTGSTDTGGTYSGATLSGSTTIGSGATLTSPTINTPAMKVNTISGQGATATLTAAQSGSQVLFDRAAGIIYTLPAPQVGLSFQFVITTSITSNNAKVITDAGTTFLIGSVFNAVAAGTGTQFIGDGTSHLAITQNGTTTGGLKGTVFYAYCVSSTLWAIEGTVLGSGTVATPFATS